MVGLERSQQLAAESVARAEQALMAAGIPGDRLMEIAPSVIDRHR